MFAAASSLADDGAASIKAGGIVFKREPGITMAKEVLTISLAKVRVDYEFRNDTDTDITTEIAFPVPPYSEMSDGELPSRQAGFDDFQLAVDGRSRHFETEVKALVKGKDVTALLRAAKIDIASFGYPDANKRSDFQRQSPERIAALARAGAISRDYLGDDFKADWTVQKRYYWSQTFPAHGTVRIHHDYTPVAGASQFGREDFLPNLPPAKKGTAEAFNREDAASLCVSPSAARVLAQRPSIVFGRWVDFILTTANTWKQPIEDFTLIVERIDPKDTVSFCWDGPVEKLDSNHFRAHTTNLIPAKELRIGFYRQPVVEEYRTR